MPNFFGVTNEIQIATSHLVVHAIFRNAFF